MVRGGLKVMRQQGRLPPAPSYRDESALTDRKYVLARRFTLLTGESLHGGIP